MILEASIKHRLDRMLAVVSDNGARGSRLCEDAARLWKRVERLLAMNLLPPEADRAAMELACYALQLPLRHVKPVVSRGAASAMGLRERSEQAAELLISGAEPADEAIVDRTAKLLRELPLRAPALGESRLLADAINLEDFGVTGLVLQFMQQARLNAGVLQVVDGLQKRQQYGYWEVRLKDGFHFEPIRQMARQRLEGARRATDLLVQELREDQSL